MLPVCSNSFLIYLCIGLFSWHLLSTAGDAKNIDVSRANKILFKLSVWVGWPDGTKLNPAAKINNNK